MVGFTSPVPLVTFRTPSNNPVKYPVSECQAARDQALRGMHNAGYALLAIEFHPRSGGAYYRIQDGFDMLAIRSPAVVICAPADLAAAGRADNALRAGSTLC